VVARTSTDGTRTCWANSVLALAKRSNQRTVSNVQVFGRLRLGWPTRSLMHVFRVSALRNALVLVVAAVAIMGAIHSSRTSGVVATPGAFVPTPTRRLKH
jgi:hypothetical protein